MLEERTVVIRLVCDGHGVDLKEREMDPYTLWEWIQTIPPKDLANADTFAGYFVDLWRGSFTEDKA